MKKTDTDLKTIILYGIIIVQCITAVIGYVLLPEQIAVQWTTDAFVSRYGSRLFLFLAPALSILMMSVLRPALLMFLNKIFGHLSKSLLSNIYIGILCIIYSLELYMIVFNYGFHLPVQYVLLMDAVLLLIISLLPVVKNRN